MKISHKAESRATGGAALLVELSVPRLYYIHHPRRGHYWSVGRRAAVRVAASRSESAHVSNGPLSIPYLQVAAAALWHSLRGFNLNFKSRLSELELEVDSELEGGPPAVLILPELEVEGTSRHGACSGLGGSDSELPSPADSCQ